MELRSEHDNVLELISEYPVKPRDIGMISFFSLKTRLFTQTIISSGVHESVALNGAITIVLTEKIKADRKVSFI
jgi:hypothetical protein